MKGAAGERRFCHAIDPLVPLPPASMKGAAGERRFAVTLTVDTNAREPQ